MFNTNDIPISQESLALIAELDEFKRAWRTLASYEDRIADYAWAPSRNRGINNQTSSMLGWAARLLIFAKLLIVFLAIVAAWLNR
jgi:hypothetical protein